MTKRVSYMIIAVLLVLSACAKQKGEEYFPEASNGALWEYVFNYDSPTGSQKGNIGIRIDGEETINGKKYYKEVTIILGNLNPEICYKRKTKEGIYRIDDKHKDQPEYLLTPFPLKVGNTWTVKTPDGITHYQAQKIVPVEVPNRKYENCLRISFQGNRGSVHCDGISYLAPGIGEVLYVQKTGENKLTYYLEKYKL